MMTASRAPRARAKISVRCREVGSTRDHGAAQSLVSLVRRRHPRVFLKGLDDWSMIPIEYHQPQDGRHPPRTSHMKGRNAAAVSVVRRNKGCRPGPGQTASVDGWGGTGSRPANRRRISNIGIQTPGDANPIRKLCLGDSSLDCAWYDKPTRSTA